MPKVNPEFESFLPPLDKQAEQLLEESIKSEGVRDPIIVWKGKDIIVDGHNRFRLATKHNKTYKVEEREFSSSDDVRKYMLENQLARRNLSKNEASEARGRLLKIRRDLAPHGEKKNEAKQLAKEQGVSPATISRDVQFANGMDKLKKANKDEANKVSTGESNINKKTIEQLGGATGEKEKEVLKKALEEAKRPHKKQTTHTKGGSVEKGGQNKTQSQVTTRPEPPAPTKPDTNTLILAAVDKFFAATDKAGRRAAVRDMIKARGNGTMPPELEEDRLADLKGDLGSEFDD